MAAPACTCPIDSPVHLERCPELAHNIAAIENKVQANAPEPVMRQDTGKARFDMIPADAIYALAELYAQGAVKYPMDGGRGWERGMLWSRCFSPLMRHAWKWWRGEDFDPETNAHHMIAVAWNAIAIYVYFTRKLGSDDRKVSL